VLPFRSALNTLNDNLVRGNQLNFNDSVLQNRKIRLRNMHRAANVGLRAEDYFGFLFGATAMQAAGNLMAAGQANARALLPPSGAQHQTSGQPRSAGGAVNWRTGQGYPRPPGWNDSWEWRHGTRGDTPRWFDPQGGEWRWHAPDKHHPTGHWDFNPWTHWNSPWQNIFP